MDLRLTPDELAFRDELRAFIRDHLPDDIRERMRLGAGSPRRGHGCLTSPLTYRFAARPSAAGRRRRAS
jgi:hypothetical protein